MPNPNLPPSETWWDEEQTELVDDRSRTWTRTRYKATDGYWIQEDGYRMLGKLIPGQELPPGAVIENNAWDHEHCALCRDHISEYPQHFNEGYSDGKEWICPPCYEKHILPRETKTI